MVAVNSPGQFPYARRTCAAMGGGQVSGLSQDLDLLQLQNKFLDIAGINYQVSIAQLVRPDKNKWLEIYSFEHKQFTYRLQRLMMHYLRYIFLMDPLVEL